MNERGKAVKDRGDITPRQLFGGVIATAALLGGGFLWGNRVQEQRDAKKYGVAEAAGPTPTSILNGTPENSVVTVPTIPSSTVAPSTHTEYVNVACDGPVVSGAVKDADFLPKYGTYSVLKAMDRTAKEANPAAPDFYSTISPGPVAEAFAVEVLTRSGVVVNFDINNTPKGTPFSVGTLCVRKPT